MRIGGSDEAGWAQFADSIGATWRLLAGCGTMQLAGGKSIEVVPGARLEVELAVVNPGELDAARRRAEAVGVPCPAHQPGPDADDQARLRLIDPEGNDVVLAPAEMVESASGTVQLGHVVLGVRSVDESMRFYSDVLGLAVSDRVRIPLRDGGATVGTFLHAEDRRHHSVALIETTPGLRHVMVELPDIDAVGVALDLFEAAGRVTRTLGRHTNDRMLSFYVAGPDGVEVEVGCGGALVDDTWDDTVTYDSPSEWGHRFVTRDV